MRNVIRKLSLDILVYKRIKNIYIYINYFKKSISMMMIIITKEGK